MSKVLVLFEQYAKMSHHLAFEGLMSTLKLDDPDHFADIARRAPDDHDRREAGASGDCSIPTSACSACRTSSTSRSRRSTSTSASTSRSRSRWSGPRRSTTSTRRSRRSTRSSGARTTAPTRSRSCARRSRSAGMPKDVKEKALQELKRLEAMPPVSAEATVSRNYIDWLVAVPWKKRSQGDARTSTRRDRSSTRTTTAWRRSRSASSSSWPCASSSRRPKGTILCFVGPPGVGKTSLAKSIARATGRKFVRLSLGGVRDEAEIRGHRRTYIGAFPGQIIQMMKKAGTINPVFLLDEVDKMSHGLPRRSVGGAARGARPGAEQRVHRSLPRRRVRPLAR